MNDPDPATSEQRTSEPGRNHIQYFLLLFPFRLGNSIFLPYYTTYSLLLTPYSLLHFNNFLYRHISISISTSTPSPLLLHLHFHSSLKYQPSHAIITCYLRPFKQLSTTKAYSARTDTARGIILISSHHQTRPPSSHLIISSHLLSPLPTHSNFLFPTFLLPSSRSSSSTTLTSLQSPSPSRLPSIWTPRRPYHNRLRRPDRRLQTHRLP